MSVLALLSVATVLGYLDRQILALLAQPIKVSFRLSDLAIGELQGVATSLSYAAASIPMGRLVDVRNRRNLMFVCVLAWSLATGLCGFARSYPQLFAARVAVGMSEAALFPAAYSLMSDLFDDSARVTANLLFFVLGLLGSTGSLALGGMTEGLISHHRGSLPQYVGALAPWRLTLLAVGLPGVFVAALFLLLREPARRASAGRSGSGVGVTLRLVARNSLGPLPWLYVLTFGTSLAIATTMAWFPTILVRAYGNSVGSAGVAIGLIVCIASVSGTALGGLWNRLSHRQPGDAQLLPILMLSAVVSATALVAMTFSDSRTDLYWALGTFVLAFFPGYALIPSLLVSMSPKEARGLLMAGYILAGMGADAVQSTLVGVLSDRFFVGPRALLHAMLAVAIAGMAISVVAVQRMRASFASAGLRSACPREIG